MTRHLSLAPIAPLGCKDCAYLDLCGGLESQQSMFGCFGDCGPCGISKGECDYTCPRKPAAFLRDWVEVGGVRPQVHKDLPSPGEDLPAYLPMIRHGYSRSEELPLDLVSLNTFDVLDSRCVPRASSAAALRDRFKLRRGARVLLISVRQDDHLETFWQHRSQAKLGALSQLDLLGVTAPNFSFFDDAPRTHSIRNLWRIVRSAEALADAGISPILHVNALVREDWAAWGRVLRATPRATHVCKEFQTGLRDPARAVEAVEGLASLRDMSGRDLHPIAVAGRRVAGLLARHFDRFTIVDSVPFIATMKRKRLLVQGSTVTQLDNPTAPSEPLDDLLQDNVWSYLKLVRECAASRTSYVDDESLEDLEVQDMDARKDAW